jgi:hypothetical protein
LKKLKVEKIKIKHLLNERKVQVQEKKYIVHIVFIVKQNKKKNYNTYTKFYEVIGVLGESELV